MSILVPPSQASNRKSKASSPVAEIRAVLDRQVAAWNRQDLETFMKGYWQAPELTFFSGSSKLSSWESTLGRYRDRYQSQGKEMGKLEFLDLRIEILAPRAAFVRGKFHLTMADGESQGLFTLILKRFPQGWMIIHDHTSG
jgi:ketosteroid isomerase-like protein